LSQKGKKPFALEIETASDVSEDLTLRVEALEVVDLSFEVFFLLGAADSAIEGGNSSVDSRSKVRVD